MNGFLPNRSKNKKRAQKNGRRAEFYAALFLQCKFYRIKKRNFKTPVGEIDLIAETSRHIIFVEVKARPEKSTAAYAITPHQQHRIMNAAQWYLNQNPSAQKKQMRFDAMLIVPHKFPTHIRNAWGSS